MLAFFQTVNEIPGYYESEIFIPKDEDDTSRVVKWDSGVRGETALAA